MPSRTSRSRCSRGISYGRVGEYPRELGRSSHDGHRAFANGGGSAGALRTSCTSLPHDDVDAACRARVKALGEAGFLGPAVPSELRRAPSAARRAHALPRARNSRMARRARRFRLRHAGARHRLDLALRLGRTQGALPAAGVRRPRHRGLRAVGARSRLRRRGAGHHRHARRRRPCPDRRREDLDLERRHRRSLRGVRPQRRSVPARAACRRSWSMPIRRACRSPSASR